MLAKDVPTAVAPSDRGPLAITTTGLQPETLFCATGIAT